MFEGESREISKVRAEVEAVNLARCTVCDTGYLASLLYVLL